METLISTLTPLLDTLRPYILPLTNSLPSPILNISNSLLGPICHTSLILNLQPTPACLSLALSKLLGIAIISASSIVKIPQLVKLLNSRDARGLSFTSYLLETASLGISLAYSYRSGFPFTAYGEGVFLVLQDVLIAAVILGLAGKGWGVVGGWVVGVGSVGYALLNGHVVEDGLLRGLMGAAGAMGVAAKVPQIWEVWRNGGTGVLSAFAVFNYLLGSLSRIFTTIQEVDDKLVLGTFVAGFVLNAVLAGQMIWYWNSTSSDSTGVDKKKEKKPIAMGNSSSAAAAATTTNKPKTPTTRRRA